MYTNKLNGSAPLFSTYSHSVPLDTVVRLPYLTSGLATHYFNFRVKLNAGLSIYEHVYITIKPRLETLGRP